MEESASASLEEVMHLVSIVSARHGARATLQEELGISPEVMKRYYQRATQLFEGGDDSAADAFLFLATLNPNDKDYWISLGTAEQRRGKNREALQAFGMACIADPDSAIPHLCAAECYVDMDELHKAVESLRLAFSGGQEIREMQAVKQKVSDLARRFKNT